MSLYLARLRKLSRTRAAGRRLRDGAMSYLQKHPPRGAAAYATKAAASLDACIAHLTSSTVYGLDCPCGGRELRAKVGHIADTFVGPLIVTCDACNAARIIFSRHLHGKEAESNRRPDAKDDSADLDREDGVKKIDLVCPKKSCRKNGVFELAVRFDYGASPPATGERRQEYFRAFAAYAHCSTCARDYRIGDLETA